MSRLRAAGVALGVARVGGAGAAAPPRPPAVDGRAAAPGVVIHVHSLSNVPDMDPLLGGGDAASDVYLTLQLLTADGDAPFGPAQTTTVFHDARNAVFGECFHTFRALATGLDGARLRVRAHDKDRLSRDDAIAHLDIDLADLATAPATDDPAASTAAHASPFSRTERVFQTRRMEMDTKRRGAKADEPVLICLRLVPEEELAASSLKKRFFFIRHGESLWNEAQGERNVLGLLQFDHGLSRTGIDQCRALNVAWREADADALTPLEKEFIRCPIVMCSPLTRCVQTALLALHSHETLRKNGVVLQRNLREVKSTLGSLDTVGVEVGAQNIKQRAKECLLKECHGSNHATPPPLTEADIRARVDPVELRSNDVASKGWTPRGRYESEGSLRARTRALMGTLRHLPARSAILVGHSLLFRELLRSCLLDYCWVGAEEGGPETCTREDLAARKVGYAAVVAVDVTFQALPEEDNGFEILRVRFLFGSGLAEE